MLHLRFVAAAALLGGLGLAAACSVYDESLLAAGGGSGTESTSSGDGGSDGEGGAATTSTAVVTGAGSTGTVTTGGGCQTVEECPGEDTACSIRACEDGICSVQNEVQGVAIPDQSPGDCVTLVCDGAGGVESVDDDADVPADDGNACTASVCAGGAPDHVAVDNGEPCSQDGGKVCLGDVCVACLDDADCDGTAECSDANTCVAPQCNDGSSNGDETGIDCGGPDCDPCPLNQPCDGDADCLSGECNGTCQPSCTDGVLNNGETTTDCGGPNCGQCPLGSACEIDLDCDSDQCLAQVCRPRLFFSEYIEGSSNNKAIEIFNYGNVTLDLAAAACTLRIYSNGSFEASQNIGLTGTIDGFGVYVLCKSTAAQAILGACEQTSTAQLWNGNDAIALDCMNTRIDTFGQIGVDPGSGSNPEPGWGAEPTNTEDGTLRRQDDIDEGDPDGSNAFDPAAEWEGFPIDTFGGLGAH